MEFSHPLARGAKVWPATARDGAVQRLLVIVTTIELDPKSKRYKKKLVDRLSRAAQDYLAGSTEATGYILVNRLREWEASRA
jgi:hypothetical protein